MPIRSSKLFILLVCGIFHFATGFNLKDDKDKGKDTAPTVAVNSSDVDSLDDRLNLNFNAAQAHGIGRYGGQSQSNSLSYGVNAGIRGPGGHYQNLYSKSGGASNGFSTGPGAPLTFANTGSRVRPGHAGGNAAAGLFGGRGSSFATSQNQNIEIPLDHHGTVLLSNLKPPSKSSNPTENSAENVSAETPDSSVQE